MPFQVGNAYGRTKRRPPVIGAPPPAPLAMVREIASAVAAAPPPEPEDDVDFGPIRRLLQTDAEDFAWALRRMAKVWPRLADNAIKNRLVSAIGSNEFMVARHDAAVGMAHAWRDPIEGNVCIKQIFLFIKDEPIRLKRLRVSAGLQIARHTERWGRTMGAVRYEFDCFPRAPYPAGANDLLDSQEVVEVVRGAYHDTVYRDLAKGPPL